MTLHLKLKALQPRSGCPLHNVLLAPLKTHPKKGWVLFKISNIIDDSLDNTKLKLLSAASDSMLWSSYR